MYETSHCGGCGYSCGSGLEYIASSAPLSYERENTFYSASAVVQPELTPVVYESGRVGYGLKNLPYELFKPQREYLFQPEDFLKPGKEGRFVGKAEEIKEFVEGAFERLMGQPFPNDVKISLLDEKRFRKLAPRPGTQGLSINRSKHNLLSEIFVLSGSLARVMLTLGHELGHVLTPTLDSAQDEEAKAYAFSLEWMRVIKEHNIANLAEAIIFDTPAQNGLHNVAFDFVHRLIKQGKRAWEVYLGLVRNLFSVRGNHSVQ